MGVLDHGKYLKCAGQRGTPGPGLETCALTFKNEISIHIELVYCCLIVSPIRDFGFSDDIHGLSVNSSLLHGVLRTFIQIDILVHAYFL